MLNLGIYYLRERCDKYVPKEIIYYVRYVNIYIHTYNWCIVCTHTNMYTVHLCFVSHGLYRMYCLSGPALVISGKRIPL